MVKPILDSFDLNILDLLQRNNRLPQAEIGEKVHLSSSATNRRIAAMEASGVIVGNCAIIDPVMVGRPITIIAEVSVESERLDLFDAVKKRFIQCPQVQQVYYVTGDIDFVLIINVADMAEYEELTRELFFREGNIKHFKTLVVMGRNKMSTAVPLLVETRKC